MRKLVSFLAIVALMASCACPDSSDDASATDSTTVAEVTPINVDDFDAMASELVGQEVVIAGTVTHVCKHGGKKMHLMGADPDNYLMTCKNGDF